jgi:hypothetical protein
MRDVVRAALRISGTTLYDSEIDDLIAAAKADLQLAGILAAKIVDTDPLVRRAIVVYCKANFGSNEDAERLALSYESLKISLALSADYTVETVVI